MVGLDVTGLAEGDAVGVSVVGRPVGDVLGLGVGAMVPATW